MRVTVVLFAALRERVGERRLVVELPDGSTIEDVKRLLQSRHRALTEIPFHVSRNRAYADLKKRLREGDELAFLPPVGGG